MITLAIDTSFYYLSLVLIKENQVIDSLYEKCYRNQSEIIFPRLNEMFIKNNLSGNSIDKIVVTKGPGSYTGVRIAMTIAKTYCSQKAIPLYTISTLRLYAGLKPKIVIIDARAYRCFFAVYSDGNPILSDCILDVKKAKDTIEDFFDFSIYGDAHLVGKNDCFDDVASNYLDLIDYWEQVESIHFLAPEYLKEKNSYG